MRAPVPTRRERRGSLSRIAPGNPSQWLPQTVKGARHCRAHEKQFKDGCWCKEAAVRLEPRKQAHELGLEVHGLAEAAEFARIVRAVISRLNIFRCATVVHQFQNQRPRQKLLRQDVCQNQVAASIRGVHHEDAPSSQYAGHLLENRERVRQMLHNELCCEVEAEIRRLLSPRRQSRVVKRKFCGLLPETHHNSCAKTLKRRG